MSTAITGFNIKPAQSVSVTPTPNLATLSPIFKANPQSNKDEFAGNDVEIDLNNLTSGNATNFRNKIAYDFTRLFQSKYYKIEDNNGINTGKGASKEDVCLAKYAQAVADDMSSFGLCYTGTKHALWSSGILNDYADMPRGDAKKAIEHFDENPDKFKKVDVSADQLKNLPAGRIVVYKKDSDSSLPGHIAITNGNGQEMSDHTDNMGWLKQKGEDAEFVVYELTDNWTYDPENKKLKYKKD